MDKHNLAIVLSLLQTALEDKKDTKEVPEDLSFEEPGTIVKHNSINGIYQNVGSGTYNLTITKDKS